MVDELRKMLEGSKAAILTDYRGLKVTEITELRHKLKEEGVEYRVVKNSLTRLAVQGTPALGLEDYLTGLERPWDIAWLPNGTVLVTERPGRLNVYVDGAGAAPVVIPIEDVVSGGGEGGAMGLEVDPSFDSNGYVYICTTSSAGAGNDVRVIRLTMSRPNGDSVEGREDIVTGMPHNDSSGGRHSGCRPRFGPDGFLWVGTGDAAIGSTPQDDDSLGGKVLRVTRDGEAAPGNPGEWLRSRSCAFLSTMCPRTTPCSTSWTPAISPLPT